MRWHLHGLIIEGATNDATLRERWRASFASRREAPQTGRPDIAFELNIIPDIPPRPVVAPQFRQGDLLEYALDGPTWVAHFPRFGQLRLDLARGTTEGRIVPAALETYGVFEDLVAIGLSPHLRRRGQFLIHAFAAATRLQSPSRAQEKGAVLLVGGIGSGKTTTGMALLNAGWKLLSNDSPIVTASTEVLSYPGLLAAYPETLARFAATAGLGRLAPQGAGRRKITVAAEDIWPGIWIDRASARAVVFPQIESRAEHALDPIEPPEALRRLLPHAVEQWDREMIPEHLRVLRNLVESTQAYVLRLGPDVQAIPTLLDSLPSDLGLPAR